MAKSETRSNNLNGWKAIASYCQRDERTVMRWAAQRGMPVHRIPGSDRAPVYALPEELAQWLASSRDAAAANVPAPAVPVVAPPSPVTPAPVRSPLHRHRLALAATGLAGVAAAWLAFGPAAHVKPTRPFSSSPRAEVAYLQGRYDLSSRTAYSLGQAVTEFNRAIANDQRFAAAYAGLAETYLMLREYADMPDAVAYPRAEALASVAVRLAPDLDAAHRSLGFVSFWWHRDIAAARREFGKALALNSDDAETHHWLATALSANGEQRAAFAEITIARRLDPQSTPILADYGFILCLSGQSAQGLAIIRSAAATAPRQAGPHSYLAQFALVARQGQTYLAESAIAADLRSDAGRQADVAAARAGFARGGFDGLIDVLLRKAEARAAAGGGIYQLARYAWLAGDASRALALLHAPAMRNDPGIISMPGDPLFSRVHDDARFAALLTRPTLKP